jgi:hypothetical protein
MEKRKRRAAWPLGEHLLGKSYELAFEDPEMAVRFARLGVRLASFLEGGYDPFAERVQPKPARRAKARKRRS